MLGMAAVIIAVWLLLVVWLIERAGAHPGRLDAEGCHTARKTYHYADGRELAAGTRHCHRLFGVAGGITLDGLESLQDTPHDHDAPDACVQDEMGTVTYCRSWGEHGGP